MLNNICTGEMHAFYNWIPNTTFWVWLAPRRYSSGVDPQVVYRWISGSGVREYNFHPDGCQQHCPISDTDSDNLCRPDTSRADSVVIAENPITCLGKYRYHNFSRTGFREIQTLRCMTFWVWNQVEVGGPLVHRRLFLYGASTCEHLRTSTTCDLFPRCHATRFADTSCTCNGLSGTWWIP